ncbi:MAG: tetratricopeptide repeat-containing sensor histidine kinase [Saprospiraceae bacterium]
MVLPVLNGPDIPSLEYQLQEPISDRSTIDIIDRLLSYYAFTNVQRSRQLLQQQEVLLDQAPAVYYLQNYYTYRGIVENQAYDYAASARYFLRAIALAEENRDARAQVELYIDYAGTCINNRTLEEAQTFLDKALRLLRIYPDPCLEARVTSREGFLQIFYSNYSRAIELLLEADKAIAALGRERLTTKDYFFLVLIYNGFGIIHERNDDPESSVRAYQKAASIAEEIGMRTRMSWIYLNIGNGFLSLGKLGKAAIFFSKAAKAVDDPHPVSKASAFANLGYCKLHKKRYVEALTLLERAETLFNQVAETSASKNYALIEAWRGSVFARTGEREKAILHFFQAVALADKEADYKQLSGIFQDMAEFYADQSDFRTAYEYQLQHSKYAELYHVKVNQRKRTELEYKYQAEQKQQEAEMLKLQATRLQLKALRAQMNPHFIYNALNSIQHFINSYQTDSASKYLAMFARLMRQSLDYSDLEIISLDKEISFLSDYLFINQKLRFDNGLRYEIKVDDELDEDMVGVPTMIVQPYVENAIEHGLRTKNAGMISIHFSLLDELSILCIIKDNGVGRKQAILNQQLDSKFQKHRSRGTSITEQRLQLLTNSRNEGGDVKTIDLEDEQGRPCGTRVEVKIPIMEIPFGA